MRRDPRRSAGAPGAGAAISILMRGAKESPPGAVTRRGEAPTGRADAEPTGARPPKGPRRGPPWRNKDGAATDGGAADGGRADGEEASDGPRAYR